MANIKGLKKLKTKADKLFSEYIRKRDKVCQKCGREYPYQLHCSHIITRSNLRLRFDPQNAVTLCASCHMWWHANPTESGEWFIKAFPKNHEYIEKVKNEIEQLRIPDYEILIKRLNKLLEDLEDTKGQILHSEDKSVL